VDAWAAGQNRQAAPAPAPVASAAPDLTSVMPMGEQIGRGLQRAFNPFGQLRSSDALAVARDLWAGLRSKSQPSQPIPQYNAKTEKLMYSPSQKKYFVVPK
jgi:hypothetical protein